MISKAKAIPPPPASSPVPLLVTRPAQSRPSTPTHTYSHSNTWYAVLPCGMAGYDFIIMAHGPTPLAAMQSARQGHVGADLAMLTVLPAGILYISRKVGYD